MPFSRQPRFRRVSVRSIELTERDCAIIHLVGRHRFIRSSHIVALLGGSPQQFVRRLRLLYHHGYLERPHCQIDYFKPGGNRHIIYGLGNKGGALLRQKHGASYRKLSWGEKNRGVRRIFLEHAVLVTDIMVALELACRKMGQVQLLAEDQIPLKEGQPYRWKVKFPRGIRIGVVPDRTFALERSLSDSTHERVYFFLEADRGTMPVKRRNLSQTSMYRKMLAYEATWSESIHRSSLGIHRFRVLIVTTSEERLQSLVEACSKLKRGRGLFLFGDARILKEPEKALSSVWRTVQSDTAVSLLS